MAEIQAAELVKDLRSAWDDLDAYLRTLTTEQMTQLTDLGGWTIKDHIIHLAVWDDSIHALLEKQPRHERMGIDKALWDKSEINPINDAIWNLHKDKSLDDVLKIFRETHQKLVAKIESMSDANLNRRYNEYQADPMRGEQIVGAWIPGASYKHYGRHRPWIEAIVAR